MKYFLGAYHLLKLKPLDFGAYKGKKILTASRCLNDSYFDAWSLSWTEDGKQKIAEAQKDFGLTETQIGELQRWADQKFEEERLGWVNTFADIECLTEYKNRFFPETKAFEVLAIYFPEDAVDNFIQEFQPKSAEAGSIVMLNNLKREIPEQAEETCMGYDLIGMELSGDYHSFHCYDISQDLREKFQLELNEYGLIKEVEDKDKLLAYANDPDHSKLPFVPWYLVKVKRIIIN